MSREDVQPEGSQEVIDGVLAKLDNLGNKLLEKSVRHTSVWKRSIFHTDPAKKDKIYEQVRSSALGTFFEDRKGYKVENRTYERIIMDTTNPTDITIVVAKFGPYPESKREYKEFGLIFNYEDIEGKNYHLDIKIYTGSDKIFSVIYQPDNFETGYEGSDQKYFDADYDTLKLLYDLFEQNAINQVKEKTVDEQMTRQKMINVDTGATFYYDPKRRDYFTKDGIPMDKDKKPLGKLGSKTAKLKVEATYDLEVLEEDEKNPFE